MPVIDLTQDPTFCVVCEKPFQHYTKAKKVKGDENIIELKHIDAHPCCAKSFNKMEKIKQKIIKTKKTLHDLRTAQLNLEFEMFINNQVKLDDDTDEIFTLLKKKEII